MAQRLRPSNESNGSMLRVDSVMVMNKGCGYAKDMSLTPQANHESELTVKIPLEPAIV